MVEMELAQLLGIHYPDTHNYDTNRVMLGICLNNLHTQKTMSTNIIIFSRRNANL